MMDYENQDTLNCIILEIEKIKLLIKELEERLEKYE